jgi:hypothetical protein
MKKASWLLLAVIVGCGESPPPELTPEKKAEMDTKMNADMSSMMNNMQQGAPPATPQPKK